MSSSASGSKGPPARSGSRTLFHYRNHGTGFGRVLCGFEVPVIERGELESALEALGFEHSAVGDNPGTRFLVD